MALVLAEFDFFGGGKKSLVGAGEGGMEGGRETHTWKAMAVV